MGIRRQEINVTLRDLLRDLKSKMSFIYILFEGWNKRLIRKYIHILCFISNAVPERPVDESKNFDDVAYIAFYLDSILLHKRPIYTAGAAHYQNLWRGSIIWKEKLLGGGWRSNLVNPAISTHSLVA